MALYKDLINSFGSPLYVYNVSNITKSYVMLRNSLPDRSEIFYSLKANPNPGIVEHIIKLGCHAEVSSRRELDIALKAQISVDKCLYTGPGKSNYEIDYAINRGVSHFSVESWDELLAISDLAFTKKKKVRVTLRINPKEQASNASINMTGVASQFGIEEDQLNYEQLKCVSNEFISIEGLHIYSGSNFEDSRKLLKNFNSIITTIKRVSHKLNMNLKFVKTALLQCLIRIGSAGSFKILQIMHCGTIQRGH